MKKILFVDNSTRCFAIFRLSIARALISSGYKVYVMSPKPYDIYLDQIIDSGCTHIPYELGENVSVQGDIKLFNTFNKCYKRISPDFIIHYTIKPNIYGSLAAKRNGIPSLSIVPGTGSVFDRNDLIGKIVFGLYKLAFKYPTEVWVLNEDDYNSFIDRNIIKDRLKILPGEGVDTTFFSPINRYKKNNPFVFLYMGRMLREKGVELLAKASQLLRKEGVKGFEIQLLGLSDGLSQDIVSKEELNEWSEKGYVNFLGSVPDVRDYIDKSDCIILPSFYGEGVPRSLMEACAMERPILTTDNSGCRDVVDHQKNGLICLPNNLDDLVKQMKVMMSLDEDKLENMGKNGRIKVLNTFDDRVIIQRYIDHLELYI